jgi:hypothetical protein
VGQVIGVRFSSRWHRPVHIGDGDIITGAIDRPSDALRFMSRGFLFHSGESYHCARRHCQDAVAGRLDPEIARSSFITAYAEDCVRRCLILEEQRLSVEILKNQEQ